MKKLWIAGFSVIVLTAFTISQRKNKPPELKNETGQPVYVDKPFLQDYSIKFFFSKEMKEKPELYQVAADRNKNIEISSSMGLFTPYNGHMLIPGELLPVRTYRYMADRKINVLASYQRQFVYAEGNAVFSNAWAGQLSLAHGLQKPTAMAGGQNFDFLVSDGNKLVYLDKNGQKWTGSSTNVKSINYDEANNRFLVVTPQSVSEFLPSACKLKPIFSSENMTCASSVQSGNKIVVGTSDGYQWLDKSGNPEGAIISKVPCSDITTVAEINGSVWFGSSDGAFRLKEKNKYDYYASQRWLPDNRVNGLAAGPDGSVLVLTQTGLAQICFEKMTLEQKAMILEDQTRKYHIRYGFSCSGGGMKNGNLAQMTLTDSDNDGLWTAMYLGGQLFRFAATKDPEAWENCKEALMAFERLYSITGVAGLPARAFEVMGYQSSGYTNAYSAENRHLFESGGYDVDSSPWRNGTDKGWVWKSTTSSDEILGHYFALSLFADLAEDQEWKDRAKKLVVQLSEHLYKNNLYLIDWNGKPTMWGKWNPEYVNGYPTIVGDRKLTSSNITGFLQSAYHFTKDEKYKNKIQELFDRYGYLENLMRPMKLIGRVEGSTPGKVESWAQELSNEWNHSDDEMYFLGYWCLYRYALNNDLKQKYAEAIRDHWETERPERDPLWDFTYAMTGAKDFDLAHSVEWLQRHPIDHTYYNFKNSERKDIERLPNNFRQQSTTEVISPAEGLVAKHNSNRFQIDGWGNGYYAETPGDVWLLPYWMGRYLGVISAPVKE